MKSVIHNLVLPESTTFIKTTGCDLKMNKAISGFLTLFLILLAGCGGGSSSSGAPPPLSADNVNLIFVVSSDLDHHAPGDIQPDTANLTSQGLQRSLLMATYLQQQVLGMKNVSSIFALTPMTHLQTPHKYPDMAAIGSIQQFALLNQITLPVDPTGTPPPYTANSYPIKASYAQGSVPTNVSPTIPLPAPYCLDCAGLDFNNTGGNNDALVSGIINKKSAGYYVFSAPWTTLRDLLNKINDRYGYGLKLPADYGGPNHVYAISIAPSGSASLVTYNSNLNPPATYPVLPSPVPVASCPSPQQAYVSATTAGVSGVTKPGNINTNQTVYIVRHAEAHPHPHNLALCH